MERTATSTPFLTEKDMVYSPSMGHYGRGELVGEGPLVFDLDGRTFEIDRYELKVSYETRPWTTFSIHGKNNSGEKEEEGLIQGWMKKGLVEDVYYSRKSDNLKINEAGRTHYLVGTAIGEIVLSLPDSFYWTSDDKRLKLGGHMMYQWLADETHRYSSRFYSKLDVYWDDEKNLYVVKKTFPDFNE